MALLKKNITAAEFFSYLHMVRTTAQLTHNAQPDGRLSTHEVMREIYEGVEDIMDGIIESYQGIYGIQRIVAPECKSLSSTPATDVAMWYKYIQDNRSIFEESWIQNQIDALCELLATSLYKLRNVR